MIKRQGNEALTLTLSLGHDNVGSEFWPEPFRAIYRVMFAQTLSLRLAVQNRAPRPITFEEALHSYFAVSDVSAAAISGLAGTTYNYARPRPISTSRLMTSFPSESNLESRELTASRTERRSASDNIKYA